MLTDVVLPKKGETKFLFVSGKGGVGKTTVSASLGVWLAQEGYRTLIVSTDIQLSLSDVFGQKISFAETPVEGVANLFAVNVDAGRSIERHREKIIRTLEVLEPGSYLLAQMKTDKQIDCGAAQAAVFEMNYYLNSTSYAVILFDTAPTGMHLEKILNQSKYVLSMTEQISYKEKMAKQLGTERVAQEIEAIKDLVRADEKAIENLRSDKTTFLMVMIPEAMPLAEIERNLPILETAFGIQVRGIVINEVLNGNERNSSRFWRGRWQMQEKYIRLAISKFPDKEFGFSFLVPEVSGLERLKIIGEGLFAIDPKAAVRQEIEGRK